LAAGEATIDLRIEVMRLPIDDTAVILTSLRKAIFVKSLPLLGRLGVGNLSGTELGNVGGNTPSSLG
jgi:hypothetical protein